MLKNRYLFSLINEIFDSFNTTLMFIKINVKNVSNCFLIRKDDKRKTALCIRYRLFETLAITFRLTNALSSFQSYIHRLLKFFLDNIVKVCLDNIFVFLRTFFFPWKTDSKCISSPFQGRFVYKIEQTTIHCQQFHFLGFILIDKSIKREIDCIHTILNLTELKSVHEMQSLLWFVNIYWDLSKSLWE